MQQNPSVFAKALDLMAKQQYPDEKKLKEIAQNLLDVAIDTLIQGGTVKDREGALKLMRNDKVYANLLDRAAGRAPKLEDPTKNIGVSGPPSNVGVNTRKMYQVADSLVQRGEAANRPQAISKMADMPQHWDLLNLAGEEDVSPREREPEPVAKVQPNPGLAAIQQFPLMTYDSYTTYVGGVS